jgi:hypothetical protein
MSKKLRINYIKYKMKNEQTEKEQLQQNISNKVLY